MKYTCVGCGAVDPENPPFDVMPRMVLGNRRAVLCAGCKDDLEEYLRRQHVAWIQERQALIKLDRSRGS